MPRPPPSPVDLSLTSGKAAAAPVVPDCPGNTAANTGTARYITVRTQYRYSTPCVTLVKTQAYWLCHFALTSSAWPRRPQRRHLTSSSTPSARAVNEPPASPVALRGQTGLGACHARVPRLTPTAGFAAFPTAPGGARSSTWRRLAPTSGDLSHCRSSCTRRIHSVRQSSSSSYSSGLLGREGYRPGALAGLDRRPGEITATWPGWARRGDAAVRAGRSRPTVRGRLDRP